MSSIIKIEIKYYLSLPLEANTHCFILNLRLLHASDNDTIIPGFLYSLLPVDFILAMSKVDSRTALPWILISCDRASLLRLTILVLLCLYLLKCRNNSRDTIMYVSGAPLGVLPLSMLTGVLLLFIAYRPFTGLVCRCASLMSIDGRV